MLLIILKIEYINIYNHNIHNLFKIIFLVVLVYDVGMEMFTIVFCAKHYLNKLKILFIRSFIGVFYNTFLFYLKIIIFFAIKKKSNF